MSDFTKVVLEETTTTTTFGHIVYVIYQAMISDNASSGFLLKRIRSLIISLLHLSHEMTGASVKK